MRLLSELLAVYPAHQIVGDEVAVVSDIVVDSRYAAPHTLFVARRGTRSDGLLFLRDAYERGCRVVASDRVPEALPADCTFIVVSDIARALGLWSQALYDFPSKKLDVYGITGTNGKTTTSFLLAHMLSAVGVEAGILGTLGSFYRGHHVSMHHTTPEAPEIARHLAWMLDHEARAVAMEVSSHALALSRVEGMQFAGAIFTNLSPDHLDFHHTMEEYARTKRKLFEMLSPDAIAVVFDDSPWAEFMVSNTQARVLRVGRHRSADVRIEDEYSNSAGSRWSLQWQDGSCLRLVMPLVGSFNIENASLAIVLLQASGYDGEQLACALASASSPPGRMERLELACGVTAVVDYAHTPDALEKLLQQCRAMMSAEAHLICVFGCGGERDTTKRPLMGSVAVRYADKVILTSDNPRNEDPRAIIADIISGIEQLPADERSAEIVIEFDRYSAITCALAFAEAGDWVVVAGKGHEEYQIIGSDRIPFSDRAVLLELGSAKNS